MAYLALSLSLLLFLYLIHAFGIVPRTLAIVSATRAALEVMRAADLDEEAKEAKIRKAAVAMCRDGGALILRIALTVAVPAGLVLAGAYQDLLYRTAALAEAAADWLFLAFASAVMIGAFLLFK